MTVRPEKVPGTYVASYPFGTEKLTLNADGTFLQEVTINSEVPETVRGSWKFDGHDSRVNLYGSMVVVDGFGALRRDWRIVASGFVSMDVEMHWSKILIGSAGECPYIKQ
jgi:hypothetical protein